jgi:phosphomevalonate kinase
VLGAVSAALAVAAWRRVRRCRSAWIPGRQRRDAAGGKQLGLGSSAAITVALTAALLAQGGRADMDRPGLLHLATVAHRQLQGGGSGSDVAAAVHGGIVAMSGNAGASTIQDAAMAGQAALAGRPARPPRHCSRINSAASTPGSMNC